MSDPNPMCDAVGLPCGLVLPNRIVKAPMAECLAKFGGGDPREEHDRLYESWAAGGWGMVITGNVQISSSFLATPWDITFPSTLSSPSPTLDASIAAWTSFAAQFHAHSSDPRTPLIVQLSHPGRQSPLFCRTPLLARPPSASEVRVRSSREGPISMLFNRIMFAPPVEMTDDEVEQVCERFGECAAFLERVGVDGVEVHGAHGYLIAQFLSPATNLRHPTSRFSLHPASPSHRPLGLELLHTLLCALQRHTSPTFCIGIKLSCGDFVRGGLTDEDALEQVRGVREMVVRPGRVGAGPKDEREEGWDFVEISGGAYENPMFATTSGPNTPFLNFTTRLLSWPVINNPSPPVILLSSSLRALPDLISAVSPRSPPSFSSFPTKTPFSHPPTPIPTPNAAHLLSFARPSILHPHLPSTHLALAFPVPIPPHQILNGDFWSWLLSAGGRVKLIGAGVGTIYWDWQMAKVARGEEVDPKMGVWQGFLGEYGSYLGKRVLGIAVLVAGVSWALSGRGA